jgi:hypothetical protein
MVWEKATSLISRMKTLKKLEAHLLLPKILTQRMETNGTLMNYLTSQRRKKVIKLMLEFLKYQQVL